MAILTSNNPAVINRRIEFDERDVIIGRHPECDVVIDDVSVSRRHARIVFDKGVYRLEDMNSRNGTLLNDNSVHQPTRLFDGSEITICDARFVFHLEEVSSYEQPRPTTESEAEKVAAVEIDEDSSESSQIISEFDVPSYEPPISKHANPESKLRALIQITKALSESVQWTEVFNRVLRCLFDLFSEADRGFILLRDQEGQLRPQGVLTRAQCDERLRISRTIVQKVMETRRPILSKDAASDGQFDLSKSIVDFRLRSIMCAPLLNSDGEAIGLIQLDTLKNKMAFDEKDLEILVTVAMQVSLGIQKLHLVEEAVRSRKLDYDLKLAHEVQQAFLPQENPQFGDYEFYSLYRPTNQVGGDYFDYISINENLLAIVVADVVGHGVAAALLMAKVAAEVRFALASAKNVGRAVAIINRNLMRLNVDRFATALIGILDRRENTFTFANAGHLPPLLRRAKGAVSAVNGESGLPLGVEEDSNYPENKISIEKGDVLVLYTDGITETMNAEGEILGIARLIAEISASQTKTPASIGREICQITNRHRGTNAQLDDMCVVCLGRGI